MAQTVSEATRSYLRGAKLATFAVFGVNGFAVASWMSRVPDVKETLELTPGNLGLLLLAISAGSLLGLPTAGKLAERFGTKRTLRASILVMTPGIVLAAVGVALAHSVPMTAAGLLFLGVGTGVWDVCQNLEGTEVEQVQKRSIMPWFHAAFSAGTVAGALVGAALVWFNISILAHLAIVAIFTAGAAWWATAYFFPTSLSDEVPTTHVENQASSVSRRRSPWTEPRTLAIGLVVLAAAFTEGTANDWMAVAFVDGHHSSNALGVLALAVFMSFMTLGRILGTGLLDRFGRIPVLIGMFATAIIGSLLVIFGGIWLAFFGAAVWGLGASLGFPVGISAAADDPKRAAARVSVVSTIGYLAFLAGPPLLGFLGDHVGVLHALLAVVIASVAAMLVIPATKPLVVSDSIEVG